MPEPRHHIVQQVTITAQRPNRTGSFELQERFSAWFRSQGMEILQTVLDEWAPPDAVLRLEELAVDLDYLQLATLETDLGAVFRRVLRETLRTQLDRVDRPWSGITRIADTATARIFAQWLFFLEHGNAPWWGTLRRTEAAYREAVHATLATEPRAALELLELLRRSAAAVDRLSYGHPPAEQQALVGALTGSRLVDLATFEKKWFQWEERYRTELAPLATVRFATDRERQVAFRRFVWQYLADRGPLASERQAAADLLAAFLRQRLLPPTRSGAMIESLLRRESPEREVRSILVAWARTYRDPAALSLQKALRAGASEPTQNSAANTVDKGPKRSEPASRQPPSAQAVRPGNEEHPLPDAAASVPAAEPFEMGAGQGEGISGIRRSIDATPPATEEGTVFYFRAAGVVLLHPFLAPLFANLGYWQDAAFTDDAAWQRAVVLTHFLATATEMPLEEDLVLPKLLCGRAFELPVLPGEPLTELEKSEADDVLRAVIKHWGAIGAASPQGLREGFFAREGKLVRGMDRWELTVERKGQDLLLGRLPWGISLVRLPWLAEFIHVTW